ncbi:MAG: amidohydrolase [Hyphomicrobiales bacterium]|nr:amidohydrolase [Hyphomicrobiales bacterium]
MIIDCHGHVSAPAELWAYKATQLASRGSHGRGGVKVSDDEVRAAANKAEIGPLGHLDYLAHHGTDMQLLSPRPFHLMHSEKPAKIVHWFTEECNNMIHRQMGMFPETFIGVCALPQVAGDPIEKAIPELERCIKMGFVGCLLNPDPYENSGVEAPGMGDRYWYPLYEKLCELDVPAHIHATGSRSARTPYSLHFINEESIAVYTLVMSDVLKDFPKLKIVVSHGGGAIPYQIGRFESPTLRRPGGERFSDGLRKLYFDTVLYSEEGLRLLIKTVGPDQCLFGAECPGVGSTINPDTGRSMDHVRPMIESFEWLAAADKKKIFSENAIRVFNLDKAGPGRKAISA